MTNEVYYCNKASLEVDVAHCGELQQDILMEYNNVILRVIDPANISTVATLLQEQAEFL